MPLSCFGVMEEEIGQDWQVALYKEWETHLKQGNL